MSITKEIARHLREIHFGNNWTSTSMKEVLENVTWQQAIQNPIEGNSIAVLVYHTNYYLNVVAFLLKGENFKYKHEDSFTVTPINSDEDWKNLLEKTWTDAEKLAKLIESFPEEKLWLLISPKYGNYYKNLHGVVEHNHYHLGQIVLLKKLLT